MDSWELEVRELVRQTLADYTAATDRFDLAGIAACFCASGVLEFTGAAAPLTGPAAIESGLRTATGTPRAAAKRMPTYVRHHVSSLRFAEVSPDRVAVGSYFSVHTDVGLDHWGRYRDVLVPGTPRWLFEHRRITVDGFAADSLMG